MENKDNATLGNSSSTPRAARIPRTLPTVKFWQEYVADMQPHLDALRTVGDRLGDLAVFHESKAITKDDVLCNVTVQAHLDFERGFALIKSCKSRLQVEASIRTITQSPLVVAGKKLDTCVNEYRNALLDGLDADEAKQVAEHLDEIGNCSLRAIQAKLEIIKNKES